MTDEGESKVPVGGELRAATLAASAKRESAAQDAADQDVEDQKSNRALVAPDSSGRTKWAQTAERRRVDSIWHGFSYLGVYEHTSYCGIEYLGVKRRGAPPRGDTICDKCAAACGFTRRTAKMVQGRQRGSRRLGNIVDRMEVAMDRSEVVLDGIERAVAELTPKKKG